MPLLPPVTMATLFVRVVLPTVWAQINTEWAGLSCHYMHSTTFECRFLGKPAGQKAQRNRLAADCISSVVREAVQGLSA